MNIKVYRIGPIAAFKKNAHSVSQILNSYYFAKYGIDSYIYLRNESKNNNDFYKFYGLEPLKNFYFKINSKNKNIASIQNYWNLITDIIKNKNYKNYIYLTKVKHLKILYRLKKILNFKIIFENHWSHIERNVIEMADLIYIISPELYNNFVSNKRIIFWNYHYPVSDHFFLKKKFLKKDTYTIGYVGSLIKEKGIGLIISALAKNELNNFKLKIIGGKDDQINKLKKEIKGLNLINKITFTGFLAQEKIPVELKDVDILIAPFTTQQTTIPLKIYEYLATGIPVVTTDIPSVKCVAKDFVFYFEPNNIDSLVKTLSYLINNHNYVNKKLLNLHNYSKKFKWDNVIKKMLEDLKNIN